MKTQNFTPMRNPIILQIRLCPVVGLSRIVGRSGLNLLGRTTLVVSHVCCTSCVGLNFNNYIEHWLFDVDTAFMSL